MALDYVRITQKNRDCRGQANDGRDPDARGRFCRVSGNLEGVDQIDSRIQVCPPRTPRTPRTRRLRGLKQRASLRRRNVRQGFSRRWRRRGPPCLPRHNRPPLRPNAPMAQHNRPRFAPRANMSWQKRIRSAPSAPMPWQKCSRSAPEAHVRKEDYIRSAPNAHVPGHKDCRSAPNGPMPRQKWFPSAPTAHMPRTSQMRSHFLAIWYSST